MDQIIYLILVIISSICKLIFYFKFVVYGQKLIQKAAVPGSRVPLIDATVWSSKSAKSIIETRVRYEFIHCWLHSGQTKLTI